MSQRILGPFVLAMMSIAAIINLRNLPIMASMGLSSVFFYLTAALFFLLPSSFVCAELASTWPEAGGIYLWVRKAFGDKIGLLAIWLEWINNVISFPASLSFMAATLTYLFEPSLAQNRIYLFSCILIILWCTTFFNMLGIKASSRLNVLGALAGTLIPGSLIIILGLYWIASSQHVHLNLEVSAAFPALHFSNWVFFASVLSGYSGMQLIAFHANNVKNPQKAFPRAIFLAVFLILFITICGSLAIASVVPNQELNLVAGVMEGFSGFFNAFHLKWAVPLLVILILIGAFSSLSAWLLGPARGLLTASEQGQFIKFFAYQNDKDSPIRILLLQGIIASILALVFLYMPNSSTAFWILIDLSSQSTLIMYILVFAAAIHLRYKEPNVVRSYQIRGGKLGIWLVAGAGILVCCCAFFTGFFPPTQLDIGSIWRFESVLIIAGIVYLSVPFIVVSLKK